MRGITRDRRQAQAKKAAVLFLAHLWSVIALKWSRVLAGLAIWLAEAVIAILPLAGRLLVVGHVNVNGIAHPTPHVEDSLPEECILSVVISGLAVISIFEMNPTERPLKYEILTLLLVLAALLSLVSGAVFYGIVTAGIAVNVNSIVHSSLGIALFSSFFIAIRKAWGERD